MPVVDMRTGRTVRPRRNGQGGPPKPDLRSILRYCGLPVLAAAALGAAWYLKSAETKLDPETLCPIGVEPVHSVLVLVDQTDQLAAGSGKRFLRMMDNVKADLPRGAKLTIVPFDGDLGHIPEPALEVCSPGTGDQANYVDGRSKIQRLYNSKFAAPLTEVAQALQNTHDSPTSPIAEQVTRIATDSTISWKGRSRTLYLVSDGLENTELSKVYKGNGTRYPADGDRFLAGVTVEYYELVNPKVQHLQTIQTRSALKDWLVARGAANVRIHAPGFNNQD
jgi:hypothetical protein